MAVSSAPLALRRLDDDREARDGRDDAIPFWKRELHAVLVMFQLGHQETALRDRELEVPVGRREGHIEPGPQHRDCCSIGVERGAMSGSVDAARETADDACSRSRERPDDLAGDPQSVSGSPPRPDHGDPRSHLQKLERPARPEKWWSIFLQVVQLGRISRIAAVDARCRDGAFREAHPSPPRPPARSACGDREAASTMRPASYRVPAARRS